MDYLELIVNWLTVLGKQIDIDKLKRQLSIITSWFGNNCIGYFTAITGFGKSLVAIIAIYRLNLKYPAARVIIVVPSLKLYKDWEDHISFFGLKNVVVFVVNTYTQQFIDTKKKWECDLLICDELHNYLSENGKQFNLTITGTKFNMFLGMSATLDEREENLLYSMNILKIDEVTMSEGRRFDYISQFQVYNFGITLNDEERVAYDRVNDIHNSNYSKFYWFPERDKNWELARACKGGNDTNAKVGDNWKTCREWRDWYAEKMNWDGEKEHPYSPQNLAKYANQWDWAMRQRKDMLHKHPEKIKITKEIIEYLNTPTITFSENTSFADELASALGNKALAYHSNIETGYEKVPKEAKRKTLVAAKKLTRENNGTFAWDDDYKGYIIKYWKEVKVSSVRLRKIAISKFESGEILALITAKALDEGFNVEGIGCAIICSGSSKKRQYIQRMGRSLRFIEGKVAKIINIYIKDSQDEAWLKRRQKGDSGIIWIDKIEQLK